MLSKADRDRIIRQAFEEELEEGTPEIGTTVGALVQLGEDSQPAHKLLDIMDGKALCSLPDGTGRVFPASEIADVNKVMERAILLTVSEATNRMLASLERLN